MEGWRSYNDIKNVLPDKISGVEEPVRRLSEKDFDCVSQDAGISIYETELIFGTGSAEMERWMKLENIGCRAKLWVNGNLVREHYGSYTEWELQLPGELPQKVVIRLQLEADTKSLSPFEKTAFSGNIILYQIPKWYWKDFSYDTKLKDGKWIVRMQGEGCMGQIRLFNGQGEEIAKQEDAGAENGGEEDGRKVRQIAVARERIIPWNCSAPALYTLEVNMKKGEASAQFHTVIGFREIARTKNQILWNGDKICLAGIAYREPQGAGPAEIERDLNLLKEAGVNYIRSLYYPLSETALKVCDRLGMWVEQSQSVYQAGRGRLASQNRPYFEAAYLEQFIEMVKLSSRHTCVLLYCLGSESVWGSHFRLEQKAARALDGSRLLNFHYPMTIPDHEFALDVWSNLFTDIRLPFDRYYDHMEVGHALGEENAIGYQTGEAFGKGVPILYDVMAPLPCGFIEQGKRDSGIHEFWGEGFTAYWEKIKNTPGVLGGAVLGAVDEDGRFSECLRECNWGILTADREQKPEYYHLSMNYAGGEKFLKEDENLLKAEGRKRYVFAAKKSNTGNPDKNRKEPFEHSEQNGTIIFKNSSVKAVFSRESCLLEGLWKDGEELIRRGPYLHAAGIMTGVWKGREIVTAEEAGAVHIRIRGTYEDTCDIEIHLILEGDGMLHTVWQLSDITALMPPAVKTQQGLDPGGLNELGIYFILPEDVTNLSWARKGIWREYPAGHPGSNTGSVKATGKETFFGLKSRILWAAVGDEKKTGIFILPDEELAVRVREETDPDRIINDRDQALTYEGTWYPIKDPAGSFLGTETMSHEKGASVSCTFYGTGITFFGATGLNGGTFDAEVDGIKAAEGISCCPSAAELAVSSRGHDKRYRVPLFSVSHLKEGWHTIRILVNGKKEERAAECYISVDYFEAESKEKEKALLLLRGYNYTRLTGGNQKLCPVRMEAGISSQVRIYPFLCSGRKDEMEEKRGDIVQ